MIYLLWNTNIYFFALTLIHFFDLLLIRNVCFIVFTSVCFFKVNHWLMYVNKIAAICLHVLPFHCCLSLNSYYVCSALMII